MARDKSKPLLTFRFPNIKYLIMHHFIIYNYFSLAVYKYCERQPIGEINFTYKKGTCLEKGIHQFSQIKINAKR